MCELFIKIYIIYFLNEQETNLMKKVLKALRGTAVFLK